MFNKECIPYAPSLIESMRSLGYSFPAAIADLIDNSISAGAKKIDIVVEPGINPDLIIIDDGCGMESDELYEAMRYGSTSPLEKRAEDDLGRFGLGLKSASLSQCRKLIVVSKRGNRVCSYSWDLDYVIEKGQWMLKGYDEHEVRSLPNIDKLMSLNHGTYICLRDFDRIKEGTGNIAETFNKYLLDMENHLSLVFHRFIEEDGLILTVNNLDVKARDPFLSYHSSTQRKKEIPIYVNDEKIILKPFILPHLSKLSQEDLDKIGGKENLKNEQGFYVYRNRRLIVWGTWFKLERKDELNKLARVRVDIPNTLDYMWSIDIKKSAAILPDIIKKNMYAAIYESVISSEIVHTHRGRKEKKGDIDYVWERQKVREGYEYVINREIPQLKLLMETLDDKQVKLLDNVMKTIEEAFPVGALYVDAAKGVVEGKKIVEDTDTIESVWEELKQQIDYVEAKGLPTVKYYKAFINVEPYCNYLEVRNRIQQEISKYE